MRAEYEAYTRNALVQLRRVREGTQIEEDHMRNRQMIVRWLMANTKAIEARTRDGKTYYVMVDADGVPRRRRPAARRGAAHQVRGRLRRRRRQLFETYGIHFDPKLRDEVVARVDKLNLPSYTRLRDAEAGAGEERSGRDHRRHDLVSAGFDQADARVPRPRPASCGARARMAPRANGHVAQGFSPARAGLKACATSVSIAVVLLALPATAQRRSPPAPLNVTATPLTIAAAEDRRAPTPGDLALIRSGLRSAAAQTVRIAVRALGRLERPELIADLVPILKHSLPEIRAEAANAIGQAAQGWTHQPASAAPRTHLDTAVVALTARLSVEDDPTSVRSSGKRSAVCRTATRIRWRRLYRRCSG